MNVIKKNLLVDAVILVGYAVVANPAWTGIGFHEWIGLGLFVLFVVHTVMHFDWIVDTFKNLREKPSLARQGNLVVDFLIFVVFGVVTVSGLMVSGAVLPALGLYADGYYFWDPLHAISAKVLLALIVVHLVVHWKWVYNVAKNMKGDRDGEGNAGSGI